MPSGTPASGYRRYDSGTLYYVGLSGFNWAATTSGSNVYFLNFGTGEIVPKNSYYRAYGRQVRCLQE